MIEGGEEEDGPEAAGAHDLEETLAVVTRALHTQEAGDLARLDALCRDLRDDDDNGSAKRKRGGGGQGEVARGVDAQLWAQEVLCKAYCAKTVARKLKGWTVL